MARKILNGLDLNSKPIVNVGDGAAASDAATKGQLDAALRGLDWKQEVIAASTANVSVAAPGTSLDGVTLAVNDRFLLKDQTAGAENGIYVFNGAATPATRAADANTGPQLSGATATVQRGTVNADRVYRVLTDDAITVGTTALAFGQVGGASGTTYTAGNGLTESPAGTFNVGAGMGILVTADAIALDTSIVTRKAAFDCAATTNPQTFTHNLGTKDVDVSIRVAADDTFVDADVTAPTVNTVTVNFGAAPTVGQYRVIVAG